MLDGLLHHLLQVVGLPRLGDVGVDVTRVDGVDDRLHVGEAGEDHAHRRRVPLADLAHELDAAHVRHALVREHDRDGRLLVEQLERAARVARRQHLVIVLEGERHRLEDGFLVVDDQDPRQAPGLRVARSGRGRAAHHPKERPDFRRRRVLRLALLDLAAHASPIGVETLAQTLARGARPRPLLGGIAQLAEAAVAPELVLELLFDELDHDRVVEEAQARDVIRDQVLRFREVGEAREHLRLHALRRCVGFVLDQVHEIREHADGILHEGRRLLRGAHPLHDRARVLDDLLGILARSALLHLAIERAKVLGVLVVERERHLELLAHRGHLRIDAQMTRARKRGADPISSARTRSSDPASAPTRLPSDRAPPGPGSRRARAARRRDRGSCSRRDRAGRRGRCAAVPRG